MVTDFSELLPTLDDGMTNLIYDYFLGVLFKLPPDEDGSGYVEVLAVLVVTGC